ncbi:MAG: plastocyanin/azurin family copper-binding protein [Oligoflexales bacterium]
MKFLYMFLSLISVQVYGAEHLVSQKGKAFDKSDLSIKVGDSIKFINEDDTAHHLMYKIDGKRFSHKQKNGDVEGSAVVQNFSTAGDYTIRCAIHPKMKLKLTVQ